MLLELPPQIESVIKVRAEACGLSASEYIRNLLERDLLDGQPVEAGAQPLESGYGMWSKYGVTLSEQDIDDNRADISSRLGEGF